MQDVPWGAMLVPLRLRAQCIFLLGGSQRFPVCDAMIE
jgi:hypothetical protein